MSYADQSRRSSPTSIAVVFGIHALIGYALISGLAYEVIKHIDPPIQIIKVPQVPPPPPRKEPVKPQTHPTSTLPTQTDPLIKPVEVEQPIVIPPISQISVEPVGGGGGGIEKPVELPKANLTRGPIPAADRNSWIGTDDYPPAALRQGVEGVVVLSAMIGTDGRVRSCLVTQSSGSQLLDDTTCRLYTSRARFKPALDADGNAVAAQRSDRFRWQIPAE